MKSEATPAGYGGAKPEEVSGGSPEPKMGESVVCL